MPQWSLLAFLCLVLEAVAMQGGMPGMKGGMPAGMQQMMQHMRGGGGMGGMGGHGAEMKKMAMQMFKGAGKGGGSVGKNGGDLGNGEHPMMDPNQQQTSAPQADQGVSNHKQALADLSNPNFVRVTMNIAGVGSSVSGTVKILLRRDWAPLGVAHLENMLNTQLYDNSKFFRVVPDFVVQFGIPSMPSETRRWSEPILDDPPKPNVGNRRGTVVFAHAGNNSRTTQLFINLVENQHRLNHQGFVPIGEVVFGMEVIDHVYKKYGERPDQDRIRSEGDDYLKLHYPQMSVVQWARIDKRPGAPALKPKPPHKQLEQQHNNETALAASENAIQQWAAAQVKNEQTKKIERRAKHGTHVLRQKGEGVSVLNRVRQKERNIQRNLRMAEKKQKNDLFVRQREHDGLLFLGGVFCSAVAVIVYLRCFHKNIRRHFHKRMKKRGTRYKL